MRFLIPLLLLLGALLGSCFTPRSLEALANESRQAPGPMRVERKLTAYTKAFRTLLAAYGKGTKPIVIEVGFAPNLSGAPKDVPLEFGGIIESALVAIGCPVMCTRRIPSVATAVGPGVVIDERSLVKPDYLFTCELNAVTERVVVETDARLDWSGTWNENAYDGGINGRSRRTVTSYLTTFALRSPDGVVEQGGYVVFEVVVLKNEREGGVSFYVQGTGVTVGDTVAVATSLGDALVDVGALASIQLLGRALRVPYWRAAPEVFGVDDELIELWRRDLRVSTRGETLLLLKRLLFADGQAVNLGTQELDARDHAIVTSQLCRFGIEQDDGQALQKLTHAVWLNLDFEAGGARFDSTFDEMRREQRESEAVVPPVDEPQLDAAPEATTSTTAAPVTPSPSVATLEPDDSVPAAGNAGAMVLLALGALGGVGAWFMRAHNR